MKRTYLIVLTSVAVTLLISMPLASAWLSFGWKGSVYVHAITYCSTHGTQDVSAASSGGCPQEKKAVASDWSHYDAYAYAWARAQSWWRQDCYAYGWYHNPPGTGYYAYARAICPPENSTDVYIPLPDGITLKQSGESNASYEISVTDMNTSETVFYAKAFLGPQGFFLWGNWSSAQWGGLSNGTVPPRGTAYMYPSNATISLPTEDIANQTQIAIVAGTGAGGKSSAYTVDPTSLVGGVLISVDKLGLLVPYFGLASTTAIGAAAAVIYVNRAKKREEK